MYKRCVVIGFSSRSGEGGGGEGGRVGTSYNGLYGDFHPERSTLFRLEVYSGVNG